MDELRAKRTIAWIGLMGTAPTFAAAPANEPDDVLAAPDVSRAWRPLVFPSLNFLAYWPTEGAVSPGPALALCAPDLYCSLAPDEGPRDEAQVRIAQARRQTQAGPAR